MTYETLNVEIGDRLCRIRFDRPAADNAIDARLVGEFEAVLRRCEDEAVTLLVLEGGPEVFCAGGDLAATAAAETADDPAPLYDLWLRLAEGPFVSVAVVRGRANAGGVGFVAACDIVLADRSATFALSELLFGLFPACVLPFLSRRIGPQRAHYMTLMTRPVEAEEAFAWGLVDALDEPLEGLLRRHLLRLRRLSKPAIARYKHYRAEQDAVLTTSKPAALAANRSLFADPVIQRNIKRYVTELKFPWED